MSHHLVAIDRKRKAFAVVATRYAGHVEATEEPERLSALWEKAFDHDTGRRNRIELVHDNDVPPRFKRQPMPRKRGGR